jgi:hypothetical protein
MENYDETIFPQEVQDKPKTIKLLFAASLLSTEHIKERLVGSESG